MTSREFSESMAFEQLEPDPAERMVVLLGLLTTRFFNAHRARGQRPYELEDFLPDPYAAPRAERHERYMQVMGEFARNSKHNRKLN